VSSLFFFPLTMTFPRCRIACDRWVGQRLELISCAIILAVGGLCVTGKWVSRRCTIACARVCIRICQQRVCVLRQANVSWLTSKQTLASVAMMYAVNLAGTVSAALCTRACAGRR
jgi:hypothetical protein